MRVLVFVCGDPLPKCWNRLSLLAGKGIVFITSWESPAVPWTGTELFSPWTRWALNRLAKRPPEHSRRCCLPPPRNCRTPWRNVSWGSMRKGSSIAATVWWTGPRGSSQPFLILRWRRTREGVVCSTWLYNGQGLDCQSESTPVGLAVIWFWQLHRCYRCDFESSSDTTLNSWGSSSWCRYFMLEIIWTLIAGDVIG